VLSHTASDTSIALRCIDEELYSLTLTLLWGEGKTLWMLSRYSEKFQPGRCTLQTLREAANPGLAGKWHLVLKLYET